MTTLEVNEGGSVRSRGNPFHFPMMAAAFVVSIKQLVEAWQYLSVQAAGFGSLGATIVNNWANATTLMVAVVCVLAGIGLVTGGRGGGGRIFGAGLGLVAIALGGAALAPVLLPLATPTVRTSATTPEVSLPIVIPAEPAGSSAREPQPAVLPPPMSATPPSVTASIGTQSAVVHPAPLATKPSTVVAPVVVASAEPLPEAKGVDQRFEQCLNAAAKGAVGEMATAAARCVESR